MTSKQPLLSVMIPTRKRFSELIDSIDSFINTASDKNNVEFILKFDIDDVFTKTRIGELRNDVSIKVFVTERLNGYMSLHTFSNYMYPHAKGRWLMFSNDDIKMLTNDWDKILENEADNLVCLNPYLFSPVHTKVTDTMPIINRRACDYLGCYAMNHAIDRWHQELYINAGLTKTIPLTFSHLCLSDPLTEERKAPNVPDDWDSTKELREELIKKLIRSNTYSDDNGLSLRIL